MDIIPTRKAILLTWFLARTIGAKVWKDGKEYATIRHDGGKAEKGYPYVVAFYGESVYYAPDAADAIRHAAALARYAR